jgi:beta-lactamase regulating signal transducer with metallopeptidase domain
MSFLTSTEGMSWLVSCSIKAGLLFAASWLGAQLLRRATAAARHQIWTLGVFGALVLPLVCWVVPSLAISSDAPALGGAVSIDATAMLVTAGPATGAAPTWPMWLAIVWGAGAMLVAARLLHGHLAARRLLRTATPNVDESWSAALREAAASLVLARRIELLRSEAIGSPMTIGVLRPRVLLPAAADGWSRERLGAVLLHELGHVSRHDTSVQLASQVACAIYWWNPLAWLAAARLRIEREHACDDLVLDAGILPSSYASDLLDVARSMSIGAHAGAICMVDPSWTEARLRRILDENAPRRAPRAGFRIAMCALMAASVIAIACTSSRPVLPPSGDDTTSLGTLSVGAPFMREPVGMMYRDPVAFRSPGSIDLSLVATEVNHRLGSLEACYERRLAVKPALAGTVVIHWVIDATGEVPEACITEDTVRDNEITDCVNKLVQTGRFPAPKGGSVDVSLPFVFTARAAVAAR